MNLVFETPPMESIDPTSIRAVPPEVERLLLLLHTHRGRPTAELDRFLADHPRSAAAHCMRAAIIVRDDDVDRRPALAASVSTLEATCPGPNEPARRHARAARAWLEGDSATALERYGAIVADHPHDIPALMAAHALDFRLGRRRMLRDRVARVLPEWDASMPGYASVLAMYAFGLEENGQYRRAEKFARRALALDGGHPSAIHTIVHVMEMRGRARQGLAFLAATESAWKKTGFAVHLAWHRALFHLDVDDPTSALATYDAQIAPAHATGVAALDDASALLWRLQLRGIDVAGRWQTLADRWEMRAPAGRRPFHAVHAMMAFVADDRVVPAIDVLEALRRADATASSTPEESLALRLSEALHAFGRADYAACIELLGRVRHLADRCGGSVAQCDIIHLTFTEAALRARKAQLARALVAERTARKPASLLNRLLSRRAGTLTPAMA